MLFFGTLNSDAYIFPFLLCFSMLADIEQKQEEVPDKFLDRLWEAFHEFTNVDPESAEGREE